MTNSNPVPIVVLISGSGSNLQAIIDAVVRHEINGKIAAVISNRADAYGLKRAQAADIPTEVIDHLHYENRLAFDKEMLKRVSRYDAGLVLLAGFMRILSEEFVTPLQGRIFNIHPSLLPKFRGLHTHQRALEAGDKQHGCSVHFVTKELDGGPVILQARVPVLPSDTPDALAARVLKKEHIIYPLCVRWFCEQRLQMINDKVVMDGQPLPTPLRLEALDDSLALLG